MSERIMSQSTEPLPDLLQLTRQNGRNNARVNKVVDSLSHEVDNLIAAAIENRWNQVVTATKALKRNGKAAGLGLIAEAADDLLHTITTGNDTESLRRVVRLIGAAGKSRRKTTRRVKK
jgi:hypothetical protein